LYTVYILQSEKDKRYYIGCTKNPEKRIEEHNQGRVKSTKRSKPWKVVYKEEKENLSFGRKREKEIKAWKKRKKIEELIKNFENR